jgi:two-component system OmpR family sensor kinase/two-component system sensor histidine kinase QseC
MSKGRPWSMRRRLLATAAVAGVLAWLAGGAAIYAAAKSEAAMLFDARLRDIAQTLLLFAEHEIQEIRAAGGTATVLVDTEGTAQGRYLYQVWSSSGRLVMSSMNAPQDTPLMPLDQTGWATRTVGGKVLRIVTITSTALNSRIQTAEPMDQRLEVADLLGPYLAAGIVLSALVLTLSTVPMLRLALRPLRDATAELSARGPADLRAVDVQKLPHEFAPAFEAVNQLMRRVDVALRSEREFVAAAAHELRTPLAGLRAQAQLAAHVRTQPEERAVALQAVQDGVDHAAHLVSQLLDLARSDTLAGDQARLTLDRQPVAVHAVLERLLGDLGPAAAERNLRIRQRFEVATLDGSDFGIGLILRNLLANALAHAPADSEVQVGTRRQGQATVLWVSDHGPGIPEAERQRMFERFYRGPANTGPGCGLGLSIVKALADAHDAQARLVEAPGGGLLAEVEFPDRGRA